MKYYDADSYAAGLLRSKPARQESFIPYLS